MGGSGGGGTFYNTSPKALRDMIRKTEDETTAAAFGTELSETLGSLLAEFNDRDVDRVSERLDSLKNLLEKDIEGSFDNLFGGSVAKHTYVDGLSDIDSLVLINETGLEGLSPKEVLANFGSVIEGSLIGQASVSLGRMAITVEYKDGMVIQLLPATRSAEGVVKVPSSHRDSWSTINPEKFQHALTIRNQECNNKLVPTIKLAKAINGQLPESQRLSGYHIESLGIAAFKNYAGEKTTAAMLPSLFERAKNLVLSPIKDRSGQSVHVDEYLGPSNSSNRQAMSHVLDRLARRMKNASASASSAQWRSLFGLDD